MNSIIIIKKINKYIDEKMKNTSSSSYNDSEIKQRIKALEDAKLDIDEELDETSTNSVQNKVVTNKINTIESRINNIKDEILSYVSDDVINGGS